MRVVVIGGGFGGMATAARLAKLGHEVTLLERSAELGGALASGSLDVDGIGEFTWDVGATSTLLPAVVRDLFRKSGRPLEREVELHPLDLVREHRFADGSRLSLPGGSRADQLHAVDGLRPGLGQAWVDHVAAYADTWDLLRRDYLERPWDPELGSRDTRDLFASRETLHKRLKRTFSDERLRLVGAHPFLAEGHDLRNVPAWLGVTAYVEQRFGAWTVPGGLATLGRAMAERLDTRQVTVLTGLDARDVVVREGRAVAVATDTGEIATDAVVCAVDPRRLPALAPRVVRTMPAMPPTILHLALAERVDDETTGSSRELPTLPHESVWHGDPWFTVHTGGLAPDGHAAWTVRGRGRLAEDPLMALARMGLDLRRHVVDRVDLSPRDLVQQWGGSPHGLLWQGRGTLAQRLGPTTPVAGVYAAGAHATPGSGIPYVGLSAALVAQAIGPA